MLIPLVYLGVVTVVATVAGLLVRSLRMVPRDTSPLMLILAAISGVGAGVVAFYVWGVSDSVLWGCLRALAAYWLILIWFILVSLFAQRRQKWHKQLM